MLLKIKSVDMDGFLGRENHPQPSDVGLVVCALSMISEVCDGQYEHAQVFASSTDELEPTTIEAAELEIDEQDCEDKPNIIRCWTCMTRDGRKLDLMDFEVELFRS